jgi:hypothetical protein
MKVLTASAGVLPNKGKQHNQIYDAWLIGCFIVAELSGLPSPEKLIASYVEKVLRGAVKCLSRFSSRHYVDSGDRVADRRGLNRAALCVHRFNPPGLPVP